MVNWTGMRNRQLDDMSEIIASHSIDMSCQKRLIICNCLI